MFRRGIAFGRLSFHCLFTVGLLAAGPAAAEKGALSLEPALGPKATFLSPPLIRAETELLRASIIPSISLSARYSISHDLSLGLAFSGEPWRWVSHDEAIWVSEGEEAPLVGRFVHSYAAFSVSLLARLYLAGYDWRFFVEPQAGWSRRMHKNLDHLRVEEDGLSSYGLGLESLSTNDIMLGAGLGGEHVWDRAAVGLRAVVGMLFGNDRAYRSSLLIYTAYDFYL